MDETNFNQLLKNSKIKIESWVKKQLYSLIKKHNINIIEEINGVIKATINDFKQEKPSSHKGSVLFGYVYILRKRKKPIEIEADKEIEPKEGDYIIMLEGENVEGNNYWDIAIFKISNKLQ